MLLFGSCKKESQFSVVGKWQITSVDDLRLDGIEFLGDGTFELSGDGVNLACKNGHYKYESETLYLTCYDLTDATGELIYTDATGVMIIDSDNVKVKSKQFAYVFYDGIEYDLERK